MMKGWGENNKRNSQERKENENSRAVCSVKLQKQNLVNDYLQGTIHVITNFPFDANNNGIHCSIRQFTVVSCSWMFHTLCFVFLCRKQEERSLY